MSDAPIPPGAIHAVSGLVYERLRRGDGDRRPGPEDVVEVRMGGSDEPRTLRVDRCPPGLAEALQLMTVGGKIRAWIPEHLGEGAASTLELELLSLTPTREYPTLPIDLTSPREPE